MPSIGTRSILITMFACSRIPNIKTSSLSGAKTTNLVKLTTGTRGSRRWKPRHAKRLPKMGKVTHRWSG